jgi:hypothetical protein
MLSLANGLFEEARKFLASSILKLGWNLFDALDCTTSANFFWHPNTEKMDKIKNENN